MAQLYFRYSTMNAGKSLDILKIANNYEEQGKKVLLMAHHIDTRYGVGKITSRVGLERDAAIIRETTNLFEITNEEMPINCVLMDEGQFLSREQVETVLPHRRRIKNSRDNLRFASGFSKSLVPRQRSAVLLLCRQN